MSLRAVSAMIKKLLGIRLLSILGALRGKRRDGSRGGVGRMVLLAVLYLYLGGVFVFMFGGMAVLFAPSMILAGLDWLYFAIFMILSFSLVFVLSIFETKSELFDCRDNELLASMPISPRHIVISRTLTVLILNYIEAAVVLLPAIIVYALAGGSVLGIIGAALVFLLLPLLATSLSAAVGYLVALLSKKFKKNSFITVFISLVFLGLYFWGYSALMTLPESELENMDNILPALESALAPIRAVGLSALLHPVATPVFAVLCIGSAYIAYRLISAGYSGIIADRTSAKRSEYRVRAMKRSSALVALSKKELRRFFSSATYMLNGALGAVFTVALAVLALVNRGAIIAVAEELVSDIPWGSASAALSPIMIAALVMLSSTVTVSSAALSLEGKCLWILKSMPVRARDVLFAKTVPHILVSCLPVLVAAPLLIIAVGASPIWWPFFFITPIAANVVSAFFGIMMNTALPKFEFENEAQPIKQSASVGLTTLILMLVGLAVVGVTAVLSLFGVGFIATLGVTALSVIFATVLGLIVSGPMARRFERLSA